MMEGVRYEEECVALVPGDRVVFYTDGVTEAARADREMFGEERLIRLVESLPRDLAARDVVDRILRGVREFLGDAEAGDDITVMVLRVIG
jgi:sigma-B regulation protein RsbU (phosphoserine phosphatase)